MNTVKTLEFRAENAICYSGFRQGQSPVIKEYPTYDQVKEDLELLSINWKYIRLYDPSQHARTVLKVIENEKLDLKVMIGCCLDAEVNNEGCPWSVKHDDNVLMNNIKTNRAQIKELVKLANAYKEIVFAVSAGNEATVEWTDHMVPVESVVKYVCYLKTNVEQPVTFCENYVPWQDKLAPLVEAVDFISLHTYPVWEYKSIEEGLSYTIDNYWSVKNRYPNKPIIITEAGWATGSSGKGIPVENANENFQKVYYEELIKWSKEENVLTFVFEAFDEDWKGSDEIMEPEKHWGLFTIDRKPKLVMEGIY